MNKNIVVGGRLNMSKRQLTKKEFEEILEKELLIIARAYEKYIGREQDYYLSLTCIDRDSSLYLSANNEHWSGGREEEHPINWYTFKKDIKYVHRDMFGELYINNDKEEQLYSGTEEECLQWIEYYGKEDEDETD